VVVVASKKDAAAGRNIYTQEQVNGWRKLRDEEWVVIYARLRLGWCVL